MNVKASPENMRSLPYRAPSTIILLALASGFLFLGVRGIIFPSAGAATLGIHASTIDGLGLMQTTAARNIGLSLLALSMIIFDQRRALAGLLFAAAFVSILDFLIVLQTSGLNRSIKHLAYFLLLCAFAIVTSAKRSQLVEKE
ncbi:MAG: DUF4267 domain-containing protein [Pseudomonadota bacterium]